ncbi:hypothetical protein GXW77_15745 [Roseomonas alkaliterrae]|uniref:hypothetical protein n=1 Tax=Neoroseomonas alkaliterrae TaxID=1452450 RepID=UPI001BA5E242|nr:hypothetical protein [Neoroseomonas alkaliterrae]MBR0677630.1 hypothetical protein [Neoroseomonas alkaliterrae]
MPPGLSHALLGAAIAAPLAAGLGPAAGIAGAVGFYAGRERRQSEEHFGSNAIPPWRWKPRALRDIAWPALAAAAVSLAIGALRP